MKDPLIIPIIGKARHGKDSFAELLKEEIETQNKGKCLIIKYGDYLKFICKEYFEWNGEKDEKGRSLLQYVGTDLCRKNNPDIWVAVVCEMVKGMGDRYTHILIPDTRFPNEIEYWDKNDFTTFPIKIIRKNLDGTAYDNGLTPEQKEHASETALDNFKPFYVIESNSIEQLRESAIAIIEAGEILV